MSILESPRPPRADNPFFIYGRTASVVQATPPLLPSEKPPPSVRWQDGKRRRDSLVATVVAALLLAALFIPTPVREHLLNSIKFPTSTETEARQARPVFTALRYDYLSSPFGRRWGRSHQGIDLAAPNGTPIYATTAGKVVYSGWTGGYGRNILIEHKPGFMTRYAHCARLLAKTGERVPRGRLIARVGSTGHSTGPHLHFEVIINGQPRNPTRYYRLERTPPTAPAPTSIPEASHERWLRSMADLMNLWHTF